MKRQKIDWKVVHSRLRASELALEEILTPNAQRVEDAYRKRAAELAIGDRGRKPVSSGVQVMVFRLGLERYAIEIKEVAEVLPLAGCVAVPGASRQFSGVISVRGELRAVLDLRFLIAPSGNGSSETGFVMMLRRPGREIGLKVDHIDALREIELQELALSPLGHYAKAHISHVSGTLVLLNVDAVLDAAFLEEESGTA
jgi:purine-binding chemotaxis protein CheW